MIINNKYVKTKKQLVVFASAILLVSLLCQISSKTYIYLSFSFNQQEIAKTLCENKDKPKSCCEGKCVLEKELKKNEQQQGEFPSILKEKIDKTEISSGYISYKMGLVEPTTPSYRLYKTEKLTDISVTVFHPPCHLI